MIHFTVSPIYRLHRKISFFTTNTISHLNKCFCCCEHELYGWKTVWVSIIDLITAVYNLSFGIYKYCAMNTVFCQCHLSVLLCAGHSPAYGQFMQFLILHLSVRENIIRISTALLTARNARSTQFRIASIMFTSSLSFLITLITKSSGPAAI